MEDLPILPFERILSELSFEDRLKSRAVSKGWRNKFTNSRMKIRLVNGAFAESFINFIRFASFIETFGPTILSNLKHLRLCDFSLNKEDRAAFTQTLQSFGQLEELDIIRFRDRTRIFWAEDVELQLPMLHSIHLEEVYAPRKLALNAPTLKKARIADCSALKMELIHNEPVEKLFVDRLYCTEVKNLKNLQSLYINYYRSNDSTLLSSLEQLKEIHLVQLELISDISDLFEQKEQHGRTELKVYLRGLLLSGPDDLTIL